jgi:hypothetical protein
MHNYKQYRKQLWFKRNISRFEPKSKLSIGIFVAGLILAIVYLL